MIMTVIAPPAASELRSRGAGLIIVIIVLVLLVLRRR
jgi:hypothetical protein